MLRNVLFFALLTGLAACNNHSAHQTQDSLQTHTTPSGSVTHITGTYQGTLPCADCPGKDYQISLYDDHTYQDLVSYQGRGNNIASVETGTWKAVNDSIVMLERKNDSSSFLAAEGKLVLLDRAGKRIEGVLASNYELKPIEGGDRRVLLASKKTAGINFFASGNEPSWTLDIDKKKILFKMAAGDSISTSLPNPSTNLDTLKVYKTKDITVTIRSTTCADDMSGYMRPNTVQLQVGDKTYSGCGEFIK